MRYIAKNGGKRMGITKKRGSAFLCAALLIVPLFLCGCGEGDGPVDVVGEWVARSVILADGEEFTMEAYAEYAGLDPEPELKYIFDPDGTATLVASGERWEGTYTVTDNVITAILEGTEFLLAYDRGSDTLRVDAPGAVTVYARSGSGA